MARRPYRVLLSILPHRRRGRFASEMSAVFADLNEDARRTGGIPAMVSLWMRESLGLVRFAWREWRTMMSANVGWGAGRGPRVGTELRWAWRGLRARGASGLLSAALLLTVLSVNSLVFAVTDSLILRRAPYPSPERIVTIEHQVDRPEIVQRTEAARLIDLWRGERAAIAATGGYLTKGGVFLTGSSYEKISTADLTVGALDVLGVAPKWGRAFTDEDLRDPSVLPALLGERLARRRFGRPEDALGQRVEATGMPLVVIGVMSQEFAFPSASFELWRGIDPAGPMTQNFGGVHMLARLAAGVDLSDQSSALAAPARRVGAMAGLTTYRVAVKPYAPAVSDSDRRTMLFVLSGAALCLLLVACANIASIELAHTVRRARTFALQAALGATRARIGRLVALEGLLLIGGALGGSLLLTWLLAPVLVEYLPRALRFGTENPISLDHRALWFTLTAASLCWLLSVVPAVVAAARPQLTSFLALEGRAASSSRASTRLRQMLTLLQVAAAVVLVIGGLLYVRSYRELLHIDKGFDTTGLATVSMSMPSSAFASSAARDAMTGRLLEELRKLSGVVGASRSGAPPSTGDSPMKVTLEVDGRAIPEPVFLGRKWIDDDYFDVTRIPLREGRYLQPGDALTDVVVSETFARRLWPNETAVGRSFRDTSQGWFQATHRVVGVVGDFRTAPRRMPGLDDDRFYVYVLLQPAAFAEFDSGAPGAGTAARPRPIDTGGSYAIFGVMVRLESASVLPAVLTAVQRVDPRMQATAALVDETYADQHANVLLATRVVGAFGIVAFLTAMAGLYGVMSFLMASRTREIGIRMALGATARDITQMVLASSGSLVASGAILGVLAAAWASKWIEAQLYGVSPTDPMTYMAVAMAVALTSAIATWRPARQAARVDPAVTLRAE